MHDVRLPTPSRSGVAPAIRWLIEKWRSGATSGRTIDPDALPDAIRRDLGFRDGRASSAPIKAASVDLLPWL
jgi:hypothetical protein